ncbi:hypothetical protein V5N11_016141 [Cardamine amara subsp. amara]|uniref:Uncharacterized protein n=1 Tax=Cardamine amara subsp. amara TaxID=228776 RepID=A0ABD0ZXG0_CARAN
MFGFLFGWRKASKCRSVMKQLQYRLKLLKNKKYAISSHLRHDIAQLLRIGERDRALHRAQQLILDENLMSLYDLLLHFSDFILLHLSYIRRHKDLPDGINEAVSTFIFASARCGDLPELRTLRILFGERYGKHFVDMALNLLPSNHVNPQIIEKLSKISVSDDVKTKLLGEIAEEYGLHLEVLALEYTPEFHKNCKVLESGEVEEEKEVYKFTLTDEDIEEKQEHSHSKAYHRKVCNEDDYIEEEVMEKDKRVFRFREDQEERKKSRRRSRSALSRSPIAIDMDCWRYYYKGKRRRRTQESGQCYHIVYNVFTMWSGQEEKVKGERSLKEAKHVHPKLPDYDQIVSQFTALRRQQKEQQNML